ncbi:MAG: hypothetical protein LBT40_14275 [Deltaproteobacteria bacterium]|nr:hypothetical protein [Deltaproteobacteria bacterium]
MRLWTGNNEIVETRADEGTDVKEKMEEEPEIEMMGAVESKDRGRQLAPESGKTRQPGVSRRTEITGGPEDGRHYLRRAESEPGCLCEIKGTGQSGTCPPGLPSEAVPAGGNEESREKAPLDLEKP